MSYLNEGDLVRVIGDPVGVYRRVKHPVGEASVLVDSRWPDQLPGGVCFSTQSVRVVAFADCAVCRGAGWTWLMDGGAEGVTSSLCPECHRRGANPWVLDDGQERFPEADRSIARERIVSARIRAAGGRAT